MPPSPERWSHSDRPRFSSPPCATHINSPNYSQSYSTIRKSQNNPPYIRCFAGSQSNPRRTNHSPNSPSACLRCHSSSCTQCAMIWNARGALRPNTCWSVVDNRIPGRPVIDARRIRKPCHSAKSNVLRPRPIHITVIRNNPA